MSRRREYLKAAQFDSSSMSVECVAAKNESGTADVISSEIIDFAAKLFHLASKRGRVNSAETEVFDEAI